MKERVFGGDSDVIGGGVGVGLVPLPLDLAKGEGLRANEGEPLKPLGEVGLASLGPRDRGRPLLRLLRRCG